MICYGWKQPGMKVKSKKPGVKVFVATAPSGAHVDPWVKERTILEPGGSILEMQMQMPQLDVVQRCYKAATVAEVCNQC